MKRKRKSEIETPYIVVNGEEEVQETEETKQEKELKEIAKDTMKMKVEKPHTKQDVSLISRIVVNIVATVSIAIGGYMTYRAGEDVINQVESMFDAPAKTVYPSSNPEGKTIIYKDVVKVPYFIPLRYMGTNKALIEYLTYAPYTKEHIAITSYYCPNSDQISHLNGYCDECDPSHVKMRDYDATSFNGNSGVKEYKWVRNNVSYIQKIQTHEVTPNSHEPFIDIREEAKTDGQKTTP